jgi:guanylate cyclase
VGQIYMAVSGAPEKTPTHAQNVCDVSVCMMQHVKRLKIPSGTKVDIRIGTQINLPFKGNKQGHV